MPRPSTGNETVLHWEVKSYASLAKEDLHSLLILRQEVFVVEQDCPYLDADDKDVLSWHVLGSDTLGLAAYARIVKAGVSYNEISIGRVLTHPRIRRAGLGKELMKKCFHFIENELKPQPIRISAQTYLSEFYTDLGFKAVGKGYLEDGIPHVQMLRP